MELGYTVLLMPDSLFLLLSCVNITMEVPIFTRVALEVDYS